MFHTLSRTLAGLLVCGASLSLFDGVASAEMAGNFGYTVLHSFAGGANDGNSPTGALYLANLENKPALYGTTAMGGTDDGGTVYQVKLGGGESLITWFDTAAAFSPEGGVVEDGQNVPGYLFGVTVGGGAYFSGEIYAVAADGSQTDLYDFCTQANCADGGGPNSGLTEYEGYLYGTTPLGGANGRGVVFAASEYAGGGYLPIYSFCSLANCRDGDTPEGQLLVYNSNLYGVTETGGKGGYGVVYELDGSGNETVLYKFDYTHGAYPLSGVIADGAGNLYGATAGGGPSNNGVAYKLSPEGTVTLLCKFANAPTDGAFPLGNLVLDGQGNVYGVANSGGPSGAGLVYKISPKGKETVLHAFTEANGDGGGPASLIGIADKKGLVLYGTTSNGGVYGDGTVFKLKP